MITRSTWPTREEYDLAMLLRDETVYDKDIRQGTLAEDNAGIIHYGSASLYTCMYRVDEWMVRCFRSNPPRYEPPPDIKERYQHIHAFCKVNKNKVSALLETYYIDPGIEVPIREDDRIIQARTVPIVKMRYLKAPKLGDFIAKHYQEKRTMEELSRAWMHMICELEDAHMAHGDMDLTNVLVTQQGSDIVLKLIDYDNVWIPPLAGWRQTEHGHKSFQHPTCWLPNERPYDAEMDRFSALVMYISLKALAARPKLYEEFGADDTNRLLLSAEDLQKEYEYGKLQLSIPPDTGIERLYHVDIAGIAPYLDELRESLYGDHMPARLDTITSTFTMPSIFIWEEVEDIPSHAQAGVSSVFVAKEIEDKLPGSQSAQSIPPIQRQQPPSASVFLWNEIEDLPSRTSPEAQPQQPEPLFLPPDQPPLAARAGRDEADMSSRVPPQNQPEQQLPHWLANEVEDLPTYVPPRVQSEPSEPLQPYVWRPALDANAPTEEVEEEDPLRDIPRPSVDAREVSSAYSYGQQALERVEVPVQDNRDTNETREIIAGAIFLLVIIAIIVAIILFILWRLGIIFPPSHPSHSTVPLIIGLQAALPLFPVDYMSIPFAFSERLLS